MAPVLSPGRFDPLHLGHIDGIAQSVALFGKVVVGVKHNPGKSTGMFDLEERKDMIRASISYLPSSSVQSGSALQTHYTSSKGALLGFTKCLAMALGEHGITANMIPPGSIDTPMLRGAEIMQREGAVEFFKHFFLDFQILEHCLNDQIHIGDVVVAGSGRVAR